MASSKLKLKLLVDTVGRKVLFAEAGKDVVDFLFSVLALPLGHVVRLLTKEAMVGCLGNLYDGLETLDDTYLQDNQRKGYLLNPKVPSPAFSGDAALTWKEDSAPHTYYRCADKSSCRSGYSGGCVRNGCGYFSDHAGVTCPSCGATMSTQMKYAFPPGETGKAAASSGVAGGEKGFVKGVVTYMVMDDMAVAPMSAISSIALLNKFGVKDLGSLEETTVELGMTEAVAMLKASLKSTTVLTDVFLPKK